MKLLVCGSSASEGFPVLFCSCRYCREAEKRGGKDCRSRTAYMLGDEIKIDFGPDIFYHRERYRLHFDRLRHIFITHPHKDHFSPVQLLYHAYRTDGLETDLVLHGTARVLELMRNAPTLNPETFELKLDELQYNKAVLLKNYGISFIPVKANHKCEGAVNYIVAMPGGFTFFIATDSALFFPETWAQLAKYRFDLMILDATAGMLEIENGSHMNAHQALDTVQRLRKEGIAKKECRFVVNHFAHCGKMLYDDLEKFFLPHGIEPAYDGMNLELEK